ncbi:hypothetical protein CLOM_g10998 [Closterium sp. NIES-68]|nr:hypothetical protein CLOM_g10998 [Closterium sp. NIES-68]
MAHPTVPVRRGNAGSSTRRILAAARWLAASATLAALIWAVYAWTVSLPAPVRADVAPPWSFSEERAMEHVRRLAAIGPHEFASPKLERAMEVVLEAIHHIRGSIPPCSVDNTATDTSTPPPSSSPAAAAAAAAAASASTACMDVAVQHASAGWLPIGKDLTVGGAAMTIAYEHVRNVVVRVGVRPQRVQRGDGGERGEVGELEGEGEHNHPRSREDTSAGAAGAASAAATAGAAAGAGVSSAASRLFQRPSMLVSAHVDTVFAGPGVGDCTSNVAVMLELIGNVLHALTRSTDNTTTSATISGSSSGGGGGGSGGGDDASGGSRAGGPAVVNDVVFVLNSGEEEGLVGAHAFVTQHPWAHSVRAFIDLEAMGIGGPSSIFQAGPSAWLLHMFQASAPRPLAIVFAQDIFRSGLLNAGTDFAVYQANGGLSGLDFVFMKHNAVYHTKFDSLPLLDPGSLQQLGDNLLPFLLAIARSPLLALQPADPVPWHQGGGRADGLRAERDGGEGGEKGVGVRGGVMEGGVKLKTFKTFEPSEAIFLDFLSLHLFVIATTTATLAYRTLLSLTFLLLAPSILSSPLTFLLSLLSLLLTLLLSLLLPLSIAFLLPLLFPSTPTPFLSLPLLLLPLFAAPAAAGAILGSWLGRSLLLKWLRGSSTRRISEGGRVKEGGEGREGGREREVEGWQWVAGVVLWAVLLAMGVRGGAGASYLAAVWLLMPVSRAILSLLSPLASRSTTRAPSLLPQALLAPPSLVGAVLCCCPPILFSANILLAFPQFVLGALHRADMSPGSLPLWACNVVAALVVAVFVSLALSLLLPSAHKHGASLLLAPILALVCAVSIACLFAFQPPAFTTHNPRAVLLLDTCQAATRCTSQPLSSSHTPSTLPLSASCHPVSPTLSPSSSSSSQPSHLAQNPLCSLLISPLSPGPFSEEAAAITASTGLPLRCSHIRSTTSNHFDSSSSSTDSATGSIWQWLDFGGVFKVQYGCYGDRRGMGGGRKEPETEREKHHHPASILLSLPLTGSVTHAMCGTGVKTPQSGCQCQETTDRHGAAAISVITGGEGTGDEEEGGAHLEQGPREQREQQEQREQEQLQCVALCAVCTDAGWVVRGTEGHEAGLRTKYEKDGAGGRVEAPVHVVLISARHIVHRFHVAIDQSRVAAFSLWRLTALQTDSSALLPLVPTRHLTLPSNSTPLHHLMWKAGLPLQPGNSTDVGNDNSSELRPTALLVLHKRGNVEQNAELDDSMRPLVTVRGDVSLEDGDAHETASFGKQNQLSLQSVVESLPSHVSTFTKSSFPFPFTFVHRLFVV